MLNIKQQTNTDQYLFLDIDGVINSERSSLKYAKQWSESSQVFRQEVEQYMHDAMENIKSSGFRYGKLHLARAFSVQKYGIGIEGGSKPDPIAISNLNSLCKALPALKVVISSTWRVDSTVEELQKMFELWGMQYPGQIVDKTADGYDRPRATEILEWLSQKGLDYKTMLSEHSIAILDDMDDMGVLNPCLIQTDPVMGFSKADLKALLLHFE